MKVMNVEYEMDEMIQAGGKAVVSTANNLSAILEVLTAREKEELQALFAMKNMLHELKVETTEVIKDLAKQVLKEILQPEQVVKKLTKKEQFELDVKTKSEERMLSLIKKHSKKK